MKTKLTALSVGCLLSWCTAFADSPISFTVPENSTGNIGVKLKIAFSEKSSDGLDKCRNKFNVTESATIYKFCLRDAIAGRTFTISPSSLYSLASSKADQAGIDVSQIACTKLKDKYNDDIAAAAIVCDVEIQQCNLAEGAVTADIGILDSQEIDACDS